MHRLTTLVIVLSAMALAAAKPAKAQQGNTLTIAFPGVPTGNCAFMMQASDVADGTNYFCNALTHAWYLGGGGVAPVTPSGTLTLNHLMLGGGTTVAKVDSACVTDGAGALSGCPSISSGTTPTTLGNATGGFAATFSTAGTSAAVSGQGYIRGDSTTGFWVYRHSNGTNEVQLGTAYELVSSGAIGSLSALNGPSQIVICTATCSLTPLTPPAAGYQLCVIMAAGVTGTITLNALGNSAMYGKTDGSAYGTAGTGTAVSTSTTGNRICAVGRDATHYETNGNGTFTFN